MNNKERKLFWDKLCSLRNESDSFEDIIKYPKYLYRYKSLTLTSLEDIKNNTLSF